jgi:DNA topoisomerase-1
MKLLIVESPIQARRIISFMPGDWRVEASRGHLRDLPADSLGIDLKHNFVTHYEIAADHFGTLKRLQKAAAEAEAVYLGTAPDREGENIAAQLADLLKGELKGKPLHRITFSAVTPTAVQYAIENPRQIDNYLVDAQQTRRTLDRLIGYLLSPLASRVLKTPHSVGRVQMAALWLLAARERDIKNFKARSYAMIEASFEVEGAAFTACLSAITNQHGEQWNSYQWAQKLAVVLKQNCFYIDEVTNQVENRAPQPPFTTAALLQAASDVLHLTPDRAMIQANALYEQGLITHPRTDSVYVPADAQDSARAYIAKAFGEPYVPVLPNIYKVEALATHEAIRPTGITYRPQMIPPDDGAALYKLIWQRFIASQMAAAQFQVQTIRLQVADLSGKRHDAFFTARYEQCTFDGFYKLSGELPAANSPIPSLTIGQMLQPVSVTPIQHWVQPLKPFTDSSLIAAMEAHGVGRPATYASTIKLLSDKGYISRRQGTLVLTNHGQSLCTFLSTHFPETFAADFTAQLEQQLDQIAVSEMAPLEVLRRFWKTFSLSYRPLAAVYLPNKTFLPSDSDQTTDLGLCSKCGGKLVVRYSKKGGQFAACEHYPKCDGRAAPVALSVAAKAGR